MKKYNVPMIEINMFKKESVVTESSTTTTWVGDLNNMSDETRRAVKLNQMKEVLAITF